MNSLNMQADAQQRMITRNAMRSLKYKELRPHAFLAGQHDETLEWIVCIDNTTKCECAKPWYNNDHQCMRYFRSVQSAIAFEISFNRK